LQAEKQSLFFERLQVEHGSSGQHFGARTSRELELHRLPDAQFVQEVYQKTKRLSDAEWKMRWKIRFVNEPGIDYGGVSREFFEKLGRSLFSPETGLFVSFDDAGQGLVQPNPHPPAPLTLEYFKFAGQSQSLPFPSCPRAPAVHRLPSSESAFKFAGQQLVCFGCVLPCFWEWMVAFRRDQMQCAFLVWSLNDPPSCMEP
jgi:hypothetical protein